MKQSKLRQSKLRIIDPSGARLSGRKPALCRILVVDRNSDLRLLYTDALVSAGCRVDVVEDGSTAWEVLQGRRYHLLLTENDPPDLTGDQLIRKLRSACMELPVVIATGRLPTHEPAPNPSLQFAATLRKPFVLEALMDTVRNVLRSAVPMWKLPSRRRRRPNPERAVPIDTDVPYEKASQEQAVDVR
jgi:DNA-binding response OmpR family regulator